MEHFDASDTKARRSGIGASDAGAVAGVNKYMSPYKLWSMKTGRYYEDLSENMSVKWGNRLESIVREAVGEDFGINIIHDLTKTHFCDLYDVPMYCHIDGFHYVDGGIRIDEIKCPSVRSVWSENVYPKNGIPFTYIYQGIHMALVLEQDQIVKGVDYWVFVDREIRKFSFEWDDEAKDLGADYIKQLQKFWRLVQNDEPPEIISHDDLNIAYPTGTASSAISELSFDEYSNMKERIKELEKSKKAADQEIDEIKLMIKKQLGENSDLRDENGNLLATWKDQERSSFDTKAFKESHPDLWEAFQKRSQFRTLRLK